MTLKCTFVIVIGSVLQVYSRQVYTGVYSYCCYYCLYSESRYVTVLCHTAINKSICVEISVCGIARESFPPNVHTGNLFICYGEFCARAPWRPETSLFLQWRHQLHLPSVAYRVDTKCWPFFLSHEIVRIDRQTDRQTAQCVIWSLIGERRSDTRAFDRFFQHISMRIYCVSPRST